MAARDEAVDGSGLSAQTGFAVIVASLLAMTSR